MLFIYSIWLQVSNYFLMWHKLISNFIPFNHQWYMILWHHCAMPHYTFYTIAIHWTLLYCGPYTLICQVLCSGMPHVVVPTIVLLHCMSCVVAFCASYTCPPMSSIMSGCTIWYALWHQGCHSDTMRMVTLHYHWPGSSWHRKAFFSTTLSNIMLILL